MDDCCAAGAHPLLIDLIPPQQRRFAVHPGRGVVDDVEKPGQDPGAQLFQKRIFGTGSESTEHGIVGDGGPQRQQPGRQYLVHQLRRGLPFKQHRTAVTLHKPGFPEPAQPFSRGPNPCLQFGLVGKVLPLTAAGDHEVLQVCPVHGLRGRQGLYGGGGEVPDIGRTFTVDEVNLPATHAGADTGVEDMRHFLEEGGQLLHRLL